MNLMFISFVPAGRSWQRRERLPQAADQSREDSFGLLIQLFLGYPEVSYAARSGAASKRIPEQHPLPNATFMATASSSC